MEERKDICEGYDRDSVQQLDKLAKDKNERFPIYPLTYIQAVYDARSKERLDTILWKCNNVYLPWMGSPEATRLELPMFMRRAGIYVTYRDLNDAVVTERCVNSDCISDDVYGKDENWVTIQDGSWNTKTVLNRYGYNVTAFGMKGGSHTLETAIKDVPYTERILGQKITFAQNGRGWVTYQFQQMSMDGYEDAKSWKELNGISKIEGDLNIVNHPDEEDITVDGDNKLKLADKEYSEESFSGMGRIYLRKNIVEGVNTLTQGMISKPNTIYIIQYDYDLGGQTIEIPENCVLDFQGCSLRNGILKSNDTIIEGNSRNSCMFGAFWTSYGTLYNCIIDYKNDKPDSVLPYYSTYQNSDYEFASVIPSYSSGMCMNDDYIFTFVITDKSSIGPDYKSIFTVSDHKGNIISSGVIELGGHANDAAILGDCIIVPCSENKTITKFKISDLVNGNMTIVKGSTFMNDYCYSLDVDGDFIYTVSVGYVRQYDITGTKLLNTFNINIENGGLLRIILISH